MVEASFATHERDLRRAADLYESLLARYPDDEAAYARLSRLYVLLAEPDRALETLDRGLEALPHSAHLHNEYGYRFLAANRYAEAIREFQLYASRRPNEPNPLDSLGYAYLNAGQPAQALASYASALKLDPVFPSHEGRAWAFAMTGRYDDAEVEDRKYEEVLANAGLPATRLEFMRAFRASRVGRYQDADVHIARGLAVAAEHGETTIYLETLGALLAIERGQYRDGRDMSDRARAALPQVPGLRRGNWDVLVHLLAGVSDARGGSLESAHRELRTQRAIYDDQHQWQTWWHGALAGEIALVMADFPVAEAALSDGEPRIKMVGGTHPGGVFAQNLPFRDGRARAKKAQGDLDGAIRIYRELLSWGISSKWMAMLEPRYVLRLARLLDQTGDAEGARAEYERFLELWKDADEGLPELEEARSYLSTTRSTRSID